jgi:hypothetical protein
VFVDGGYHLSPVLRIFLEKNIFKIFVKARMIYVNKLFSG